MTLEEAREAAEKAELAAYAEARKLFGPGMSGPTDTIVNPARLRVLEALVIGLIADLQTLNAPGTKEMKVCEEMCGYWELVKEEIAP